MSRWRFSALLLSWLLPRGTFIGANVLPQWETVLPQHRNSEYLDRRPRTRYSHTQTVVGNEIVIAFGYFYDHDDSGGASWEADAWALSAKPDASPQWRLITKGEGHDRPVPRMNHVAVAPEKGKDGRRLVVFGGTDKDHAMLNDLWELDVATGRWLDHAVPLNLRPLPRNCFSAALLEGQMFIYGGFHLGDLWRYSFETYKWKLMIDMPKADALDHPGKRASHSAVTAPNGKDMYVYGGFRFQDDVSDPKRFAHGKLDDMWVYRYDANKWELVPQVKSQGGREFFSMELVPWTIAADEHIGLVTFAGVQCDPDCSLRGSLAFFSLRDHKWRRIHVTEEPYTRYQHGMSLFQDALWIFGGESYDPHMYHNSVQRLTWPPQGSDALDEEEL